MRRSGAGPGHRPPGPHVPGFAYAASRFVEAADGSVVSVAEPGQYRIALALSPWRLLYSDPVRLDLPGSEQVTVASGLSRVVADSSRREQ